MKTKQNIGIKIDTRVGLRTDSIYLLSCGRITIFEKRSEAK